MRLALNSYAPSVPESATETAKQKKNSAKPQPGQPFNPYRLFNGIFIPEAMCRYRGLSLGAKMAYGRLCRYAGRDGAAYPSISTLASELGIGKTQARVYVQELEREQFIAVNREKRHFGPNGTGGSNTYVFLWHVAFEGARGESRKAPPVRKTGGVPIRKTEGVTRPENRARRESSSSRESIKESQSTSALSKARSIGASPGVNPEAPKRLSEKIPDDDDQAWQELLRRTNMSQEDERQALERMHRKGIRPRQLLKLATVENSIERFDSPVAGLKYLINKFEAKTNSSSEFQAAQAILERMLLNTDDPLKRKVEQDYEAAIRRYQERKAARAAAATA